MIRNLLLIGIGTVLILISITLARIAIVLFQIRGTVREMKRLEGQAREILEAMQQK